MILALKNIRTVNYYWEVFESGFANLESDDTSIHLRITKRGVTDWTVRPLENVSDVEEVGIPLAFVMRL